jgi:threonine aldolase
MDPTDALQFASDNTAGICPEAAAAINEVNRGYAASYGNDELTRRVCDRFREMFECDADVFFAFNGTAANSLALASLCQSYQSVICTDVAHIETDECGAPEFFSNGSKLLISPHSGGKLLPAGVADLVRRRSDIHYPRPRAVSLTQCTELGSVYRVDEVRLLCEVARENGLKVHMDGARFANAVARLECRPADLTWRAGVDVLCFGGTKMGLPAGEAILFFDRHLAADFAFRCKQAGQLASKMRFLSAPWLGMLDGEVWLKHARHANAMAARLAAGLKSGAGLSPVLPPEANSVFVQMPSAAAERLRQYGWQFYNFIGSAARFMCSWSTQPDAVDRLCADVARAVRAG